jgi:hypothetical protein
MISFSFSVRRSDSGPIVEKAEAHTFSESVRTENEVDEWNREPRIGFWWCFCCEKDLCKIETEADVKEVLDTREYHNSRVWETREAALSTLSTTRPAGQ